MDAPIQRRRGAGYLRTRVIKTRSVVGSDDVLRLYRLKVIEMAHRRALQRRNGGPAHG